MSRPGPNNPFTCHWNPQCADGVVEDRLCRVKNFTLAQCRQALALDDLQKTVRLALERRVRKLERESSK